MNIPNSYNVGKVVRIKNLWSCQKHCADARTGFFSYWDNGDLKDRWCACKYSNIVAHSNTRSWVKSGPARGCNEFLLRPSITLFGVDKAPDWMICGTEKCEGCWHDLSYCYGNLDMDQDYQDLHSCPKGYHGAKGGLIRFEQSWPWPDVFLKKCEREA